MKLFAGFHKEIKRDSSKLTKFMVDKEFEISGQVFQIIKDMQAQEEHYDLNTIAHYMDEYNELSLLNKTGEN